MINPLLKFCTSYSDSWSNASQSRTQMDRC